MYNLHTTKFNDFSQDWKMRNPEKGRAEYTVICVLIPSNTAIAIFNNIISHHIFPTYCATRIVV